MRTLPADIQSRIDLLQQTIYENANPSMVASIVKAKQTIEVETLQSGTQLGGIDLAFVLDDEGVPTYAWVIFVSAGLASVNVYDMTVAKVDWETPTKTFTLATVNNEAVVRQVAIAMDGSSPWLFWVERYLYDHYRYNNVYALQWDGAEPASQPAATELYSIVV
jgi:hypothetical protein